MKAPAFQFYAADFLIGVMGMSDEEVGIYMRMLCFQWIKGGLPACPKEIKRLIGSKKPPSSDVMEKFSLVIDGKVHNERMESERQKQADFRGAKATSGSSGGQKRAERFAEAKRKGDHTLAEWNEIKLFFSVCVRCGSDSSICKDHIIPIYQGGSNHVTNLQPLCSQCNNSKGPESIDFRLPWCVANGKQMPSEWVASATENEWRNVALHSSSSSSSSELPLTPRKERGVKSGNSPTSLQAIRISKLYNRRHATPWTDKEVKAFKAIGQIDPEDLEIVCGYTQNERTKGENGRHRRDLATFLNNFHGELDRARAKPGSISAKKSEFNSSDLGI